MVDNENIYVDAGQPATLHDRQVHTDLPTLQEAVIAWHRLPPERQRTATISAGAEVYTAQEINRLHYGPKPSEPVSPLESATVSVPPHPQAGTASAEITIEILPRAVSPMGPLETSRGIPAVMQESLPAFSGGIASGRAELTASPGPPVTASIEQTLSDRPVEISNAARALVQEFLAQIEELKQSKPNDPGRLAQYDALIPFLEKMAAGLGNLADALDALVAPPGGKPEPILLGKAADTARWLQKATTDWLEANKTIVIDVPVRLGLFGLGIAFVHMLGIDGAAVTASLAYLAGLRSTQPRN